MIDHQRRRSGYQVCAATGPSTLQRIRGPYHRTTGRPGQGVDARAAYLKFLRHTPRVQTKNFK